MLTHQRIRCSADSANHATANALVRTPCVVVHTEESQVERFVARAETLGVPGSARVVVDAVAPPLIYVHAERDAASLLSPMELNAALRRQAERAFGGGRIAAHRVYQLDWSCADPQWIPHSQALGDVLSTGVSIRVVAFPRSLQTKITELLAAHGIATHPTQFTHELFVTTQPKVSSLFHFGLVPRQQTALGSPGSTKTGDPSTRAEAPCRAFFKLQESLVHHVHVAEGDRVLDVGASPGGWTDCLLRHGAHVVAVDPGELTIPLAGRPVTHIQSLLEDALDELTTMKPFTMAVCDINVRVPIMTALMLRVAPLLHPGARIVFTLKLGKKPTPQAVDDAFAEAQRVLAPSFHDFQLVWLHANTQNERTLFATKTPV